MTSTKSKKREEHDNYCGHHQADSPVIANLHGWNKSYQTVEHNSRNINFYFGLKWWNLLFLSIVSAKAAAPTMLGDLIVSCDHDTIEQLNWPSYWCTPGERTPASLVEDSNSAGHSGFLLYSANKVHYLFFLFAFACLVLLQHLLLITSNRHAKYFTFHHIENERLHLIDFRAFLCW